MASSMKLLLIIFFIGTLFLHGALGNIMCENLPTNACAFAISSSGKRCLLENSVGNDGKVEYQCKTSEVVVGSIRGEHIETDDCVKACGVDRKFVGLSSDSLVEPNFIAQLCSPPCYHNCPNIVDLYFNLAAGEGVYLPKLCDKQRNNPRRDMVEIQSNGGVASSPGPAVSDDSTQRSSPRRVMVELSVAPGPIPRGDLV